MRCTTGSVVQYFGGEDEGIYLTQAARKRKIGRAHIESAMASAHMVQAVKDVDRDPQIVLIGDDDLGVELAIIAVILPDKLFIIRVTPTSDQR